jgi:glycosyltransferase involved in cell wall biosynthesis
MAYNEEIFLQYMIDHYRGRFPDCHIVIYDNCSTDNTAKIAKSNSCEVVEYNTNGQVNDDLLRNLKNTCWKQAKTDWVIVCDVDELLDIDCSQLKYEESVNTTIIDSEGWNMVNMEDNYDLANIKHGIAESNYNKKCLFNRKMISDINYVHGAHRCFPDGIIQYNEKPYKLLHYKYVNPEYSVQRLKWTEQRLSDINRKNKWGVQYTIPEEEVVRDFRNARVIAEKILD